MAGSPRNSHRSAWFRTAGDSLLRINRYEDVSAIDSERLPIAHDEPRAYFHSSKNAIPVPTKTNGQTKRGLM
jgi:hypothetical protein